MDAPPASCHYDVIVTVIHYLIRIIGSHTNCFCSSTCSEAPYGELRTSRKSLTPQFA